MATRKMTDNERAALAATTALPDSQIDLTDPDAPEVRDWSHATRGALFRPLKKPVTMRVDADLIDWFQRQGKGYQTRINDALREYVDRHETGKRRQA